tara:strand:+ start:546 stop:1502 length:957 start_codon:yes stop_codon:yes gene_type:complete
MKKLLTFLLIGTMFGCGVINLNKTVKKDCTTKKECCKKDKMVEDIKTSQTFKPKFDVDGATCGTSPTVNANSVQFGTANSDGAGRVVSQQGYKSITQIRAKADFSHLTSNFVVSTFYMVNNPTNPSLQPKGSDYCDAGGNNPQWNCQEVDFFETNKNVVFQHTMHIGDGSSSAPQNYQISYSTTQDTCFTDLTPKQGLVSWGGIKLSDPVDIIIDLDSNGMTVTFSQDTISTVVYKMGPGFDGSTFDDDQIKRWEQGRQQGYWLVLSQWQDLKGPWAPGSKQNLYNWSCSFGNLCGASEGNYFKVYDIEVDAESIIKE